MLVFRAGTHKKLVRLANMETLIRLLLLCLSMPFFLQATILRKTIEGYFDLFSSLLFNTIKSLLIMHAFHSSRHLQSNLMLYFSHASMV